MMKMNKFLILGVWLLIFLSIISSVFALGEVALIVKDADSLSVTHEKRINRTLAEMGLDVVPIDKDSTDIDYSDYALLVVAGRPLGLHTDEYLDSFVANIPIIDHPTIGVDAVYPDDWGWVEPGGLSTVSSTSMHEIEVVNDTYSITQGMPIGDIISVHTVIGETILDLLIDRTNLIPIATLKGTENPVIAVAEPGTVLSNDKILNTRIVFFGVTNPVFWDDDAEDLFKKSVEWLLEDTDEDGISDVLDNCPDVPNPDQLDTDSDSLGNVCDEDDDNDGIPDISDFCALEDATGYDDYIGRGTSNPGKDGCVDDVDSDNIKDNADNCVGYHNPSQLDTDSDGIGNPCDICPFDPENDVDQDEICGNLDNCPFKFNPDQEDSDDDGIGDVCQDLPYQVFLDVDDDGFDETAINENSITDDGFEVYEDDNPDDINTMGTPIDGDLDGMTDWLIIFSPFDRYEKYWDPDDEILTEPNKTGSEYYIDTDGDGTYDIIYDSRVDALVVKADVDSDYKLEVALDTDVDSSFDEYTDSDWSSKLLDMVDGDEDGKNDFIIGIAGLGDINDPAKYWDPDDGILTDIKEVDTDNDGEEEYLIDVDGDGNFDKVYNDGQLHDLSDLIVDAISINPASPKPGDNVTIGVTVINMGGQDALKFKVEVWIDETVLGSEIISLGKGNSTSLEFEWNDVSAGSYVIKAVADSEDVISESDEENNEKTKDVSLSSQGTTQSYSGGGGGSFKPKGTANFTEFPDKVEVFTGDKITLNGKFESKLNYNLYDVTLSLEADGLNPDWYSISPETEYKMTEGEKIDVSIEFNIPENAEIYTYPITLKASAGSKVGDKTFSESFNLIILEKLEVLTTTSTTTTSTSTTTIPEEERPEPSPLTGFYLFIQSNPLLVPIIIIVIVIIVYSTTPKGKGKYVFGKGWVKFIPMFKNLSIQCLKSLLTKW